MNKEIERIKDIKDIFNKKLENYELDKKFGQLSIDSIHSLFPTDIELLLNYINQLEKENEELKSKNWRMAMSDYQKLVEENKKLKEENKKLNLELVSLRSLIIEIKHLINILGGSDES